MNKQDEDKAKELAIKSTRDIDHHGNEVYNVFVEAALQEMAAWKEQQMIEKTILFLRQHNCTIAATIGTEKAKQFIVEIEDCKKYMEEN